MFRVLLAGFATFRAREWMGQKLGPIVAVFFASCVLQERSITASSLALVQLVLAIAACAAWVSVLNDATDRAQDRAAGKVNRLEGKSAGFIATMLAVPVLVAIAVAFDWREDPALLVIYGTNWLVFALYSMPPVRLKERGIAGVVADATGAHLLPAMLALVLAHRAMELPVDARLLGAVALWSGGFGLRGILWHQLMDHESDRRAGVATFVGRHGRAPAVRLARWVALPMELTGLAAMLVLLAQPLVVLMLALYALVAALRIALAGARYIIVQEATNYRVFMIEFNDLLFPLVLVLVSITAYPNDMLVLIACLVLFFAQVTRLVAEGCAIGIGAVKRIARATRSAG